MRIALSIEYNGSAYFGWQKQKINKIKTIQYHIDKAVSRIANNEVSTVCAGRTDTGVHAFSQIVHFDSSCERENYKWIQGINSFLPSDILVKNIYHVDNDFHARYSAVDRTYRYIILNQTHPSTYFLTTALHYSDKINISKIKSSFKYLRGKKDYCSFQSSGCSAKSSIKHIKSIKIAKHNNFIYIDITANSFLYHMVRNIVGALLDVGSLKKNPDFIHELIEAHDRKKCGKMVSPSGLYLMSVSYPKKYNIPNSDLSNII